MYDDHNGDAMKFLVFLLFGLLLLSIWLVCHFASPRTSFLTRALVILSFTLGFAGVALLPVDLTMTTVYDDSNSTSNSDSSSSVKPNATYGPWLLTYWSTFVLAWLVLPICRESLLSGEFTLRTQLAAGCRAMMKGMVLLLVVGVCSLIAMAIKLHQGFGGVVPVLMAMGNTYGLLLVSLLLGYGLVSVPTQLWRQSNPQVELQRIQIMAASADEHLFESVWELQDVEQLIDDVSSRIGSIKTVSNDDNTTTTNSFVRMLPMDPHYARCVDILLTRRKTTAVLHPELQRRRTNTSINNNNNNNNTTTRNGKAKHKNDAADPDSEEGGGGGGYPSLEYLAKLNRRLQHAQNEIVSAEQRWNSIVQKNDFYNNLVQLSSTETPSVSSNSNAEAETTSLITKLWYTILRKPFFQLSALFCAILSGMILWSEATLSIPIKILSPFALFMSLSDAVTNAADLRLLFWLRPLTALLPFVYMAWCVYGSMFKLSLFGPYQLRGRKTSSGLALLFNAQYLVRLQFPLGYNYLQMIKYENADQNSCAFAHVMKNMETVPFFGTSFSVYAPLLILALCGFTLCHGYARILSACGIDHEDAIFLNANTNNHHNNEGGSSLESKVNEGITLLRRSSRQQQQQSSPSIQMTSRYDNNNNTIV